MENFAANQGIFGQKTQTTGMNMFKDMWRISAFVFFFFMKSDFNPKYICHILVLMDSYRLAEQMAKDVIEKNFCRI